MHGRKGVKNVFQSSDLIRGQSDNRFNPTASSTTTTVSTISGSASTTATTATAATTATTTTTVEATTPMPKKLSVRQRLRDALMQDYDIGVHPIDDHGKVR